MTRNNRSTSHESPSPSSTSAKDNLIDLPDLSAFREEEKQHILHVLERDENLRNKHLSRFNNLRKEVTDLEHQSRQASSAVCAQCQTPFGYIFNTGDACPKCGAKVCKQCRLMYNVHDNGWLCQLCCKQMQLMSYSGEWLYSGRSKLQQNPTSPSNARSDSFPYAVARRNSHLESSSDSEPEVADTTAHPLNRFNPPALPSKLLKSKAPDPNNKVNKMLVQGDIDEQKLNFIRDHLKRRPVNISFTQPLPRRAVQLSSISNTRNNSSREDDAIVNQPLKHPDPATKKHHSPMATTTTSLKPPVNEIQKIEPKDDELNDGRSIVSSELTGPPKKSKRQKLRLRLSHQPTIHDSKLSLESNATEKSSHRHLSASMQNLRDTVHRLAPTQLLSSRTSLSAQAKRKSVISTASSFNDEDLALVRVPDTSSKSNAPAKSEPLQASTEQPKQSPESRRPESPAAVPLTKKAEPQPKANLLSATHSIANPDGVHQRQSRLKSVLSRGETKPNRTASVGTRASAGDSDEEIDKNFRQTKLVRSVGQSEKESLINSQSKITTIKEFCTTGSTEARIFHHGYTCKGSRLSLNSAMSENRAHYDLDITGTIELKLAYNLKSGSLEIFIHKCTNLAAAKRNQTSNPYCKSYLLPDPSKSSKQKTSVKKHTTDPAFDEILRYHVTNQEFSSRIIWISVWSQSSLGRNDFLGEIHIPLAHCTLDKMEEYTLLHQMPNEDAVSTVEPTADSNILQFELTFIEDGKNKDVGTIQVSAIQGAGIYYGKHPVDAICKGMLMPDKVKRKLPTIRKGPSPKWDIPLRWENIRRKNLPNTSLEISIWCQERFRKTMLGSIRLYSSPIHVTDRSAKGIEVAQAEKSAWEAFLKNPTKVHRCQLPLRPATQEK